VIPITADELARWRSEIELGVAFRDKEFGTYRQAQPGAAPTTSGAGKNLDYFEQGARPDDEDVAPPLNLVFAIVKNVVPTQFFQNPRVTVLPDSKGEFAGEDAFYVRELMNRDLRDPLLRIKQTGQLSTFDGYLLASGFVKVGYATEFGPDILPTEAEEKKTLREKVREQVRGALEAVGVLPPKPEVPEPDQAQPDTTIRSERPYLQWISPFDMVIDPRARSLTDARWIAQRIRRTLGEIKRDRRYAKVKHTLEADAVEADGIPETFIEEFQTVDIWETHYKDLDAPTGIRVLTLAMTQADTKALMHEDNAYDLGDWQYEWLTHNKHGHRLYPISTISVIRPLIDRINSSLDAVLEQVDKFVTKVAYNDRVGPDAQLVLETPTIGARVKVDGTESVVGAIAVISMEQVKQDMMAFINHVMDLVILITGLTRAQLTGLTQAQTATEAQIGQGGQNLRRADEGNVVSDWFTCALSKYWRVKAQFQDLTEVDLVKDMLPDAATGMMSAQFYPAIDEARAARLKASRFRFDLEVSSMQKPNLEILRAQFGQFVQSLMEPIVTQGLALEGKRLSATEIIKQSMQFFAEGGLQNAEKIIVPVVDPMQRQALMNYGMKPAGTNGNGQLTGAVPTYADQVSAAAGEKGQGASPV